VTLPLFFAHLVTSGLGPVYDGILHFVLSPEDSVPVLALSLLVGLRGASSSRGALFVLPAAWLAGGLAGLALKGAPNPAWTAASFLLFGGLVAADAKLPVPVTTLLAALLGFFHGYSNGAAMAKPSLGALALLGIVAAVFVLVALAVGIVAPLRAAWARIVVRVAGSWIAAVGLLLLGWSLRRG